MKDQIYNLIKKTIEVQYTQNDNCFVFKNFEQLHPFIRLYNENYYFQLFNIDSNSQQYNNDLLLINIKCNNEQKIKQVNNILKSIYDESFINKYYYNIFVYGTLKKGYKNSDLCSNTIRNIPYTIKGTMYDSTMDYPILTLKGNYDIHGQIITIPKKQLINFDILQGYPNYYDRKIIKVNINNKIQNAFVYVMDNVSNLLMFPKQLIIESGCW